MGPLLKARSPQEQLASRDWNTPSSPTGINRPVYRVCMSTMYLVGASHRDSESSSTVRASVEHSELLIRTTFKDKIELDVVNVVDCSGCCAGSSACFSLLLLLL